MVKENSTFDIAAPQPGGLESSGDSEGSAPGAEPQQAADAFPTPEVFLASGSPRRRELLTREGVQFTVRVSDVDETLEPDVAAHPLEAVKKLAERKARAVVEEVLQEGYEGTAAFVAADTMVVCDGEIFGKPHDRADAHRMLRRLQGHTHDVLTGVSVWLVSAPAGQDISLGFRTFVDRAAVTFHALSDDRIEQYLDCGESFDKAGAYAAQGEGAHLIAHIEGDRDTVIGLPVRKLLHDFPYLL